MLATTASTVTQTSSVASENCSFIPNSLPPCRKNARRNTGGRRDCIHRNWQSGGQHDCMVRIRQPARHMKMPGQPASLPRPHGLLVGNQTGADVLDRISGNS